MIRLFKKDETNFDSNGLGVLDPAIKENVVEEKMNGIYNFDFAYLSKGKHASQLEGDMIIKAPTPDGDQLFRVYKVTKNIGFLEVNCYHIFYDLAGNFIEDINIVSQSGQAAITHFGTGLQYATRFKFVSNIVGTNSARMVRLNAVQALLDSSQDNSFLSRWGGEIKRDNFTIYMNDVRGNDKGFKIRHGKNLTGYEANIDHSTVVTRIMPYGYNGLMLPEKYVDSPLRDKYAFTRIKKIEYTDIKAIDPDASSNDESSVPLEEAYELLRQAAALEYSVNKVDIPTSNFKVTFDNLADTKEYADFKALEKVEPWDYVTVIADNLDIKSRMISYKYDAITQAYKEVELGNYVPSFSDTNTETNNKLSNINNDLNNINNDLNTVAESANGKNSNYYGSAEPSHPVDGDLWYKKNGDKTELWQYDGKSVTPGWKLIVDDATGEEIRQNVDAAQKEAEEAKVQANDAVGKANQAVTDAGFANDTATQAKSDAAAAGQQAKDALTSAGTAITDAKKALTNSSSAMADSTQARKDSATAVADAVTALTDAQKALTNSSSAQADSAQARKDSAAAAADAATAKGQAANALGQANTAINNAANALDKFNNMQVGGVNLLLDTDFNNLPQYWTSRAGTVTGTFNGHNVIYYDAKTITFRSAEVLKQPIYDPALTNNRVLPSHWYTLSFYAKGTGQMSTYVYGSFVDTIASNYVDGVSKSYGHVDGSNVWDLTDDWTRHTHTFKSKSSFPATDVQSVLWRLFKGNEAYICMPQLEAGTLATDYSPAPEDVQQQFTNIDGELASKVNQTTYNVLAGTVDTVSTLAKQNQSTIGTLATKTSVDTVNKTATTAQTLAQQNANELLNKASTNTVDTLTQRVTTAESTLSQTATKAELALTKTDVDKLGDTVANQGLDIAATADALKLKADSSTVSSLDGRVTNLSGQLDVQADKIAATVTANDVTGMLNGYATQTWTQNQIKMTADGINGTMSSIKSTVDGQTTSINDLKADSSSFKSQFTTVNNTLGKQTTDIGTLQATSKELSTGFNTLTTDNTTNKNDISQLKQTATELNSTMMTVQTQVQNSAVGTNLLTNTGDLSANWRGITSISTTTEYNGHPSMVFASSTQQLASQNLDLGKLQNSTKYTASFWAKADNAGDKAHTELWGSIGVTDFVLTTNWVRYTAVVTSASDANTNITHSSWFFGIPDGNKGNVYIAEPKLELGTTATDWCPNPADNATVTALSKLSQTVDGMQSDISKKIEQKDLNGYATQTWTQSQIKSTADNINLSVSKVQTDLGGTKTQFAELAVKVDGITATVANKADKTQITQLSDQISLKADTTALNTLKGTVDKQGSEITLNTNSIKLKADQSSVDTLKGTVDKQGSAIDVNTKAIALKASQSTVDTLTGRVSTAEGKITVQADQISQTVSKTELTSKLNGYATQTWSEGKISAAKNEISASVETVKQTVDNLQIGGRNLVLNSDFENPISNVANVNSGRGGVSVDYSYQGSRSLKVSLDPAISNKDSGVIVRFSNPQSNSTYTATGWLYSNVARTLVISSYSSNWTSLSRLPVVLQANTWTKFEYHFTTEISVANAGVAVFVNGKIGNDIQPFYIDLVKIEQANVATNWSIAPEDQATIDWTKSQLDITDKKITAGITTVTNTLNNNIASATAGMATTTWTNTQIDAAKTAINLSVEQSITTSENTLNSNIDNATKDMATQTWTKGQINTTADNINLSVSKVQTDLGGTKTQFAELAVKVDGIQTTVSGKADQSQITQLANQITSVVGDVSANSSQITQMKADINLRVKAGDVVNQINISPEGILIAGEKVHITGQTTIDNAVIKDAMIADIKADKITAGTLNAANVNVINLNANNITTGTIKGANLSLNLNTGEVAFQKGRIHSVSNNIDINVDEGYVSVANNKTRVLLKDGGIQFVQPNIFDLQTSPYMSIANGGSAQGIFNGASIIGRDFLALANSANNSNMFTFPMGIETFAGISFGNAGTWRPTKIGGAERGILLSGGAKMSTKTGNIFGSSPNILIGSDNGGLAFGNRIAINGEYVHIISAYRHTASGSANLIVAQDGALVRSTSASKYKTDIIRANATDYGDKLLNLPTATWTDIAETKRFRDDPINQPKPTRNFGMIAEDLADAGLEMLVVRGADGELEGINYDRIGPALIPVIAKLKNEVEILKQKLEEKTA
ncbi:phage tail spike protein [Latilactobacillus sakei]|uniref:phage tail spike protein n=2 Tax=Bacteria TaxID=2 RepID=UPI003133A135